MKTELFDNADVTASILYISEHELGSMGIIRGQFAYLFSFMEVGTSNIVSKYRVFLSKIKSRISQHCGRVATNLFDTNKKEAFSKIYEYVCMWPKAPFPFSIA